MQRVFLFVLVSLCASVSARSQTGAIDGTVLDSSGKPFSGAVVEINQSGGEQHYYELMTNSDGHFLQTGLSTGHYMITTTTPDGKLIDLVADFAVHPGQPALLVVRDRWKKLAGDIIVENDGGFFAIRDAKPFGLITVWESAVFTARAYNGMTHYWVGPVFEITYDAHDPDDQAKKIHTSVTASGMCDRWQKGKECLFESGGQRVTRRAISREAARDVMAHI